MNTTRVLATLGAIFALTAIAWIVAPMINTARRGAQPLKPLYQSASASVPSTRRDSSDAARLRGEIDDLNRDMKRLRFELEKLVVAPAAALNPEFVRRLDVVFEHLMRHLRDDHGLSVSQANEAGW